MSDKAACRKFKPERLYRIRIFLKNISVMRRTHVISLFSLTVSFYRIPIDGGLFLFGKSGYVYLCNMVER